ncbi:MAG: hypothetical protein QF412_15820 [Planctomycetota bacterium]|jgi:hypothetical protein|nr:hypothetical protein [Planctomycetota bacterium]
MILASKYITIEVMQHQLTHLTKKAEDVISMTGGSSPSSGAHQLTLYLRHQLDWANQLLTQMRCCSDRDLPTTSAEMENTLLDLGQTWSALSTLVSAA